MKERDDEHTDLKERRGTPLLFPLSKALQSLQNARGG
jgi:hypothetical protein